MKVIAMLLVTMVILVSSGPANASASILDPKMVHAMVTNPVSVFGKTYNMQVGNKTYPVYYGFHAVPATVSDILTVRENNSLVLNIKNMTEADAMWIYIPQSVISADANNFLLYVDGNNTKYELATYSRSTILGFMVPAGAHVVEIKGTSVIPEFPLAASVMAAGFAILAVSRFGRLR